MGNLLNSRAGGSWLVSPSTLLGCFSPLLSQSRGEEQAATTEAARHCASDMVTPKTGKSEAVAVVGRRWVGGW